MIENFGIILGTTFMYSAPLIFAALGGVIAENSGVINIGLEGMMTIGAFVGAAVTSIYGDPWLGFLTAGLAGAALAMLHAIATIDFVADQVVSGIAINFIGPGLAIFLCRLFFDGTTMTPPISLDNKIPRPISGLFSPAGVLDQIFNQYMTVYLALLLVIMLSFFLYKTTCGLRLRAVGENPWAADSLGINVRGTRYFAVLMSGFFAGLGGAALSIAVVSSFRPTLISGQGFIALAAVIFGKWRPLGAMLACLLFGFAQGLVIYLGSTDFKISSQILAMFPYIIIIVILVGFVGKSAAPAAGGVPFKK